MTSATAEAQANGPVISFFGIANPDGSTAAVASVDEMGRDVYERLLGHRFFLVVEARPGTNGIAVGDETFEHDPADPSVRPDLQVIVSKVLGNGNVAVCALGMPGGDGVPAIDPPVFADTQEVTDAISDLGCHFVDDEGRTFGRDADSACTTSIGGTGSGFVDPTSTVQFCASIDVSIGLSSGTTAVAARVRDVNGNLGEERQIVLNVTGPTPTVTPTASQTGTVTPTPTATPFPCAGDCNRNRTVSVGELIVAVDIALRSAEVGRCLPADTDGNEIISIDELVTAVARAVEDCGTSTDTGER